MNIRHRASSKRPVKPSVGPSALVATFVVLAGLVACGATPAPRGPGQERARAIAEAVDGKEVTSTEPLVVGFRPEDRANLEVAMREGLAVVAVRGASLQVLRGCRGAGDYGVVAVVPKEHSVRIADEQELRANMPNLVPALAASLKADLQRGATVDVSLVVTAMMRTTRADVSPKELSGACAGATHYVRGASLGAFTVATGERTKDAAEAGLLAANVAGSRSSSRQERSREGDLDTCRTASPEAPGGDPRCRALLRLELAPLGVASPGSDVAQGVTCPSGLVYLDGKCTRFPAPKDLPCMKGNVEACTSRCEASNAKACGVLAAMHRDGDGVPKDENKALALAQKSCDGHDGEGCDLLATLAKAPAVVASAALEACKLGVMRACITAGKAYEDGTGVTKAIGIAVASYQRGCDGGLARACWELGRFRERRTGPVSWAHETLPIDKAMVRLARERACNGRIVQACREVARLMGEADKAGEPWLVRGCELNDGAACIDLAERRKYGSAEWLELATRGCQLGAVEESEYNRDYTASIGCNNVGLWYEREKNKAKATTFLVVGCKEGSKSACWNAASLLDAPSKSEMHERGCELGGEGSCRALAQLLLENKEPKRALGILERTCTAGDPMACFYTGLLYSGDDPDNFAVPKRFRRRYPGVPVDRARGKSWLEKSCTVCAACGAAQNNWCGLARRHIQTGDASSLR